MDTNSILYSQFANCAPVIGADLPRAAPEKALFRLLKSTQEHFVEVTKIVLDRGYGLDVFSDKPELSVTGGNPNPHLGDLFISVRPLAAIGDKFGPFSAKLDTFQDDYMVRGEVVNGEYKIQFRADDMNEVMKSMISHRGLTHDEQLVRHMNAIYHLLDRTAGARHQRALDLN